MKSPGSRRSCFYVKAYLPKEDEDGYLARQVKPLGEQLLARRDLSHFLFVRYHDKRGRHLRLRFFGSRRQEICDQISEGLAAPGMKLAKGRYIPEWERYGGPEGVGFAERLSGLSAVCALEFLAGPLVARTCSRTEFAVLTCELMLAAAGLSSDERRRYHLAASGPKPESYAVAQSFLDSIAVFLPSLRKDPLIHARSKASPVAAIAESFYERLVAHFRSPADGFAGLRPEKFTLLSSYLHMHYNRLGVSHPQEALLRHVLHDAAAGS